MSVYDKIGDLLLALRFKYHVEEFEDSTELAAYFRELEEGQMGEAILSPEGRARPILATARREGDVIAVALVDLDDIRSAELEVEAGELEELSTRVGAEKFGDRGYAPFFFPILQRGSSIYFAMGIKTAAPAEVMTGAFIDGLLDVLEWEGDGFYKAIVEGLKSLSQAQA